MTRRIVWSTRSLLALACLTTFAVVKTLRSEDFDHTGWNKILKATVTDDGCVEYEAIRKKLSRDLKAYLDSLGKASLKELKTDAEKKAFWINAYNAVCVQTLIDSGLPKEVPHAAFFGKNIFTQRTCRIAGKIRSLDDIEHRILRKEFKDNRVHAAVVCGASSCPRLRREAYTAKDVDRQLDEEARRWVQTGRTKDGKRKNYLDRRKGVLYVSKIFDWFEEDFGGSDKGVLNFVKRHASESDRKFLEKNRVKLKYLTYSWRLNSQSK